MAQHQVIEGTGEELLRLLSQQRNDRFRLIKLPTDHVYQSFEEALDQAVSRTPEEVAASRERLIQTSTRPRQLPHGKTLEDVIMGQWPGDETDEVKFEALRKLS